MIANLLRLRLVARSALLLLPLLLLLLGTTGGWGFFVDSSGGLERSVGPRAALGRNFRFAGWLLLGRRLLDQVFEVLFLVFEGGFGIGFGVPLSLGGRCVFRFVLFTGLAHLRPRRSLSQELRLLGF